MARRTNKILRRGNLQCIVVHISQKIAKCNNYVLFYVMSLLNRCTYLYGKAIFKGLIKTIFYRHILGNSTFRNGQEIYISAKLNRLFSTFAIIIQDFSNSIDDRK